MLVLKFFCLGMQDDPGHSGDARRFLGLFCQARGARHDSRPHKSCAGGWREADKLVAMKKSPHASQEALNGIDRVGVEILDEWCMLDNHLAAKRSEMLLRILYINPKCMHARFLLGFFAMFAIQYLL